MPKQSHMLLVSLAQRFLLGMTHAGLPSRHHSKPQSLSPLGGSPTQGGLHVACPVVCQGRHSWGVSTQRHIPYLCSSYRPQDAPVYLEYKPSQHMLFPAHRRGVTTPGSPQQHILPVHLAQWSRPACTRRSCPVSAWQATIARCSWVSATQGSPHAACPRPLQAGQS